MELKIIKGWKDKKKNKNGLASYFNVEEVILRFLSKKIIDSNPNTI